MVCLVAGVHAWCSGLLDSADPDDRRTAQQVAAALNVLELVGPTLGRPLADRVSGSSIHNLKELRPGSAGSSEVRILFVFDPERQAVLLVAGDEQGDWSGWYDESIPLAEERFARWLAGRYNDVIEG